MSSRSAWPLEIRISKIESQLFHLVNVAMENLLKFFTL